MSACTLAESIGMTAAAAAATAEPELGTAAAFALVVAGGLVEGLALGWFQSRVLAAATPSLRRHRYVLVTVLVAGFGWGAASAPAAFPAGDDQQPGLLVVAALAAALGLTSGALLGAAQAIALRGAVRHPWRWVGANVVAWPFAMVVIFLGATAPSSSWPWGWIVVTGAVTGAAAGCLLGAVTGRFLPSLDGATMSNRVVLAILATRRLTKLGHGLVGLELRGRRSGRDIRLPVQYAVAPGGLAVVPGRPATKTWWRNVGSDPTPVRILREGVWAPASARVVELDDPTYPTVRAAYQERWPRATLTPDQPVVLVRLGGGS